MENESYTLNFKSVPHGTETSKLIYFKKTKDLFEFFWSTFRRNYEEIIIVTDEKIAELKNVKEFLEISKEKHAEIVTIPTGEINKTFDNVLVMLNRALSKGFSRRCTFVALGGGVISDMCALASSLYKRGAQLQIIPTTLLSMSDAAIGGKTGCDYGAYKNMLGTFYPANTIYFCPEFLDSLSKKEYYSGLAEVIKTAMLYDKDLFELLKSDTRKVKDRDEVILYDAIKKCSIAKSRIVEQDITEKDIRRQLNLGHTFAHALESVAGFGVVPHGCAVAWGIGRALEMSLNLGYCSKEYRDDVFELLELYGYCTKAIPDEIKNLEDAGARLIEAMKQDKKNEPGKICFILQKGLEDTVIINVDEKQIKKVL
ncbi:MAG: 3-dehydroquinate synthase [Treponemataceae bacterium]|nr:3-dehydroquinate synthase [Treponemataceae bacterium]